MPASTSAFASVRWGGGAAFTDVDAAPAAASYRNLRWNHRQRRRRTRITAASPPGLVLEDVATLPAALPSAATLRRRSSQEHAAALLKNRFTVARIKTAREYVAAPSYGVRPSAATRTSPTRPGTATTTRRLADRRDRGAAVHARGSRCRPSAPRWRAPRNPN